MMHDDLAGKSVAALLAVNVKVVATSGAPSPTPHPQNSFHLVNKYFRPDST